MSTTFQDTQVTAEAMTSILDAIESFPTEREVTHCGTTFHVSPFTIYGQCPVCHNQVKVRSFSGVGEIEDVFDAVFQWMNRPGASTHAQERIQAMVQED